MPTIPVMRHGCVFFPRIALYLVYFDCFVVIASALVVVIVFVVICNFSSLLLLALTINKHYTL